MKKFSLTTRESSRQASRNRRLKQTAIIGGLILVAVLVLPQVLSLLAYLTFSPLVALKAYFAESTDTFPSYIRDRDDLIKTQAELEQKLALMQASQQSLQRLNLENASLKGLIGTASSSRIVASVIGRPTELPYDVLIIDQGSQAGVQVNAPVYSGLDQAVGLVAAVYPKSSVVVLVTTPGFTSTVYIYGPNIYTKAEGQGGGSLRVSVPQGIKLNLGNLVVFPALAGGVYGEISVIDSEPTRPEQYGYLTTDVSLQSLRYVSVGTAPLVDLSFAEVQAIVEKSRPSIINLEIPEDWLTSTTSTTTATNTAPLTL